MSQRFEELQLRIAENTTPRNTSMITITSKTPSFRVNFPSPIPVYELALGKLRVYNSLPNIRSTTYGEQQPNNSLVFSYKKNDKGDPDWQTIYLPTGSYEIENINDEFQRRIKSITGKESKITINVNQPTLSSSIDIATEGYAVDIYRSSIRTILGWPEKQQEVILTHNNSADGDGRHIAPNNVDISKVIALNLICDAVEGSYQVDLTRSDQAQQGYILYSFAPSVSPGYLLIEDPINPVYMRCHSKTLTSINFSLTDHKNNLIDLRGEELVISLFVKS